MEMTDRHSLMLLLQCDCHKTDNFSNICYRNILTIWQTLQSSMLRLRHVDGWKDGRTLPPHRVSFCHFVKDLVKPSISNQIKRRGSKIRSPSAPLTANSIPRNPQGRPDKNIDTKSGRLSLNCSDLHFVSRQIKDKIYATLCGQQFVPADRPDFTLCLYKVRNRMIAWPWEARLWCRAAPDISETHQVTLHSNALTCCVANTAVDCVHFRCVAEWRWSSPCCVLNCHQFSRRFVYIAWRTGPWLPCTFTAVSCQSAMAYIGDFKTVKC
jgi:hypothetical protein